MVQASFLVLLKSMIMRFALPARVYSLKFVMSKTCRTSVAYTLPSLSLSKKAKWMNRSSLQTQKTNADLKMMERIGFHQQMEAVKHDVYSMKERTKSCMAKYNFWEMPRSRCLRSINESSMAVIELRIRHLNLGSGRKKTLMMKKLQRVKGCS